MESGGDRGGCSDDCDLVRARATNQRGDTLRVISKIIIHHSATADGDTFSWRAIRDFHILTRGWLDIGYHAGCELIGDKYECMYGRPDHIVGAHASGHNRGSLGFCFVGNYDHSAPTNEMIGIAARRVLAPWCLTYGITTTDIIGHRDFSSKTCPASRFPMALLRDNVWYEMKGGENA